MSTFTYAAAPLPEELHAFYINRGYRSTATLGALMIRNQQEFTALPAVFDGDVSLTWGELITQASRFGGYLQANGIGPGDVVVWQLPNWWESLVVAYGVWAAGAISAPVVSIYREHELRQVIEAVHPSCVVAPETFRNVDHVALMTDACAAIGWEPTAKVVLRGTATGWTTFDHVMSATPYIAEDVSVDAPALVGFTSGTTSGAKGVAHSSASFISSGLRSSRQAGYGWRDRCYMPAPLAHATGLLSAVSVPAFTGCSVVLRDRWDADRAIDDIRDYDVTFSAGASIFLQSLAALAARGQERLELSSYPCGGSTIPTPLALATDAVGLHPARSWGMTECPGVSSSGPFEPADIRCGSDGRIAPGCEVRVVDADEKDLGPGEIGDLLVRGPQRTLGYLLPEHTAEAFDEEGWLRTGDLGFVTADNVLTMTGRSKEIINRGGEKISGREIEDLLSGHPEVIESAVVPAPHPWLGEQPAAFVLFKGEPVADQDLAAYLRAAGLAPQKIPGVWRTVDELPRTASGKVKKYSSRLNWLTLRESSPGSDAVRSPTTRTPFDEVGRSTEQRKFVTNTPSVEAGQDFGVPRKRPSARRTKPMDSEARWEEILNAAAKVFLQKGYEAASLQEIATDVGILKGSIYYYIKTKEDLLFEIIRRSQEVYALTTEEDDETAAANAPVRLAAFITRWTTLSPKQRDWGEVAEGSFTRLSPARLKIVIERRDNFSDFVKQIIQQGITEGAFDPSVDVSLATISVFELLRSTRQWHHPRGRLSKAAVADWYSLFIVRGLGGPSWTSPARR